MKLKTKWFVPPSLESTYIIIDLVLVFYRILRLCSSSWRLLQNIFFIVTSQLQVHTEFFVYILKISFHTLFVTWWFSFVSLFGNSSPLFLFNFISLNFFFYLFQPYCRLNSSPMSWLVWILLWSIICWVTYITATCDLGRNHLCPSVFRHQSALRIEQSCLTLYLHC